ncbi:MAG: DUF6174 domain-containing protein [Porticoccaceae bacterium]|nr:DUF6174 domain-containing protein [Porticoccaceae bacterium]
MKYLTGLFSVLLLAGCGAAQPDVQVSSLTPQQQWQALNLGNYDYEVQRSCFCAAEYVRPMQVSVRGGEVETAVYTDDASAVSAEVLKSLRTIDQWFSYIKKGRDRPFARLDVEYHSEQGYPTRIEADVDERMADDEQQLVLKNLTPQ